MGLRSLLTKRQESPGTAALAAVPVPDDIAPPQEKGRIRARVAAWIDVLQRDPTAEERAAGERRALLLESLNRTVAEAPDDVPIKYVIDRLNRHWDD